VIKERLAKLLTIKSIVTLVFVLTYEYLLVTETNIDSDFKNLVLMILSFYFGTQSDKVLKGGKTDGQT
jgi:hypothetical protein